jgi:2-keto-4-pentenoate hydratase/2-oxohepta-3-ene-1,7-dioic acid hydratase in catechol pathway
VKLATLRTSNGPRAVGVVEGDVTRYVDLAAVDDRLPSSLRELLATEDGLARAADALPVGVERGDYVTGTLLAPIPDPGKVICIGLNYRDHAEETGAKIPTEPVVFNKFPQCVIGPDEPVVLPAACRTVDYEAELVVVIGRTARRVHRADALDCVAGYANGNDVSSRDWQKGRPGGQWLLGKTPDTFAPCGPWLVTADEIADPHDLAIQLRLNGETMQDGTTAELIFGVPELIAHLTQLVTLQPGDLIFTGTPPGVGMARNPPVWIAAGDTMEVEIAGLGVLSNPVEAEEHV